MALQIADIATVILAARPFSTKVDLNLPTLSKSSYERCFTLETYLWLELRGLIEESPAGWQLKQAGNFRLAAWK
jgi:hypothetical protein